MQEILTFIAFFLKKTEISGNFETFTVTNTTKQRLLLRNLSYIIVRFTQIHEKTSFSQLSFVKFLVLQPEKSFAGKIHFAIYFY